MINEFNQLTNFIMKRIFSIVNLNLNLILK